MNLITDRTLQDVSRVQELHDKEMTADEMTEWLQESKGSYNYTDLNRVESAVMYLCSKMIAIGYDLSLVIKTTWTMGETPTLADLNRYLENISTLKAFFIIDTNVPADMLDLKIEEANDIERILEKIDEVIEGIILNFFYSNEIYSGEV